jgi:hypothetical protein
MLNNIHYVPNISISYIPNNHHDIRIFWWLNPRKSTMTNHEKSHKLWTNISGFANVLSLFSRWKTDKHGWGLNGQFIYKCGIPEGISSLNHHLQWLNPLKSPSKPSNLSNLQFDVGPCYHHPEQASAGIVCQERWCTRLLTPCSRLNISWTWGVGSKSSNFHRENDGTRGFGAVPLMVQANHGQS